MLPASSTRSGGRSHGKLAGRYDKARHGIKVSGTANVLMKETEAQADSVANVLDQVVDCALEHMDPRSPL
jgi:hypothetical protein